MAVTRLGVGGPSAAYFGFSAKEEAAVVMATVGLVALSLSAAGVALSLDSAAVALSLDAAAVTLTHSNQSE